MLQFGGGGVRWWCCLGGGWGVGGYVLYWVVYLSDCSDWYVIANCYNQGLTTVRWMSSWLLVVWKRLCTIICCESFGQRWPMSIDNLVIFWFSAECELPVWYSIYMWLWRNFVLQRRWCLDMETRWWLQFTRWHYGTRYMWTNCLHTMCIKLTLLLGKRDTGVIIQSDEYYSDYQYSQAPL